MNPNKANFGDLITTTQAAEELGVTPSRVRQLILEGRLPAHKIGRDLFIVKEHLSMVANRKAGRPRLLVQF